MLSLPISPPHPVSPPDPFRAQAVLRQHPPARLCPEDLEEPVPLPPPFAERYQVFSWHYIYHLARRRAACLHARPTVGELMMTSHLTRSMCRRYRAKLERDLPPSS